MPDTPSLARPRRRSRRRFRPAERREMVRLVLEEGRPINSVARDFGTCWTTVKHWVSRAQAAEPSSAAAGTVVANALMSPVGGYRFISDEEKAEALRLVRDEGLSACAAGLRTGIAHTTINRWLREASRADQAPSRFQGQTFSASSPAAEAVEPISSHASSDQLFTELPFDDRSTDGVADEVVRLREEVTELRVERDLLRLIVVHFITPTMDAAGMKATFSQE